MSQAAALAPKSPLLRHDADGVATQMREAAEDVPRPIPLHFEERPVIHHSPQHLVHVIRLRR